MDNHLIDVTVAALATIIGAVLGAIAPQLISRRKSRQQQAFKFVYIKMYHLRNMVPRVQPATRKYVERLGREIDVYDEFHFFKLNIFRHARKHFRVSDRSSGVVDMDILHPWQRLSFTDIGLQQQEGFLEQLIQRPSAVYFTRSLYYNGCQQGNENFAIKMEQDTEEVRMIIDFSTINAFRDIIRGIPAGVLRHHHEEEYVPVGETVPGIYVVSAKNLKKGEVLRVDFTFDWDHPTLNN